MQRKTLCFASRLAATVLVLLAMTVGLAGHHHTFSAADERGTLTTQQETSTTCVACVMHRSLTISLSADPQPEAVSHALLTPIELVVDDPSGGAVSSRAPPAA
jgi:hypothetical protein